MLSRRQGEGQNGTDWPQHAWIAGLLNRAKLLKVSYIKTQNEVVASLWYYFPTTTTCKGFVIVNHHLLLVTVIYF
jgi:hypothetical protein